MRTRESSLAWAVALGFWLLTWAVSAAPVPVIFDTDIGDDIDDTWALAMLLGMSQLDLKLIVTDYGNTPERTRLTAKILERVGRTDIPIATGIKTGDAPLTVSDWMGDFNLATYPGKVYQDGVRALIDTLNAQTQTVTLITIGPVPNIREALRRDPGIAQRARVVCTGGRIYKGFENGGKPSADWNVRADAAAWQALVAAPWEITTSPLDGSEEIVLRGRRFAQVAASDHPLARVVMDNYEHWKYRGQHPKDASSILYDTAAVYLASAEDYCVIKTLKLAVNEQGHTVRTPDGKEVRCHLAWINRDAFDDYVVQTLTESPRRQVSPEISALTNQWARPELVREVLAGHRQEARVSWWGFDARDSTKHLQQAINSRAKRLIIDRQPSAWVTRPLLGVSHQEIIFEAGAELAALKSAYRAKGDCLLTFQDCEHVAIRGERQDGGKSARLRMHKEDYQSEAYEKSEWRHGLAFLGCQDVLVQDLAIERTGGDGIYLGTTRGKNLNRNVVIRRVDCDANHRQGISVISAENLLIEECLLRNTRGTALQAGIDFEPNDPTDVLVNCVMRRCLATNNAGTGFQICPQFLSRRSRPISLFLEDCVSRGNQQHAVHLCSAPKDPPTGQLRITRFLAANDGMAGLSVQFNPYDGVGIELADSILRDCACTDSFFPPLYVQGLEVDSRPAGNLHFKNVTVKDDRDRSILKIRDRKGYGVKANTGEIILERQGRKTTIAIDDAWLETMRE
ncbi:MAG TPA: nucleoside hydrolase [Candidatus Paceibacterota bacterium]|nr:nucleoside hydrolase [Candidatus Paceibacterota bacterium]